MSTHYGSSGRRRPNATPATLPAHPAMHLEARLQDLDRLWQRPDRALPPATAHHSSTAALSAAPLSHLLACNDLGAALCQHSDKLSHADLRLVSEDAGSPPPGSVQLDKFPRRAPRTLFHLHEYGFPTDLWSYREGNNIRFFVAAYRSFLNITLLFYWTCHRLEDGKLAWYRTPPARERLYALDRLLAAPGQPVVFCLDETSLAAAERAFPDRIATTGSLRSDGAGKHFTPLAGRDVVIMAGRKRPCRAEVREIREALMTVGCRVAEDVLPARGPRRARKAAAQKPSSRSALPGAGQLANCDS